MLRNLFMTISAAVMFFASGITVAAEMDHSKMGHDMSGMDHSSMNQGVMKKEKGSLEMVHKMPASGKSREAGADERYAMESMMDSDKLADRCAKASRGLMMVDNDTWMKCGGKPEGWSQGPGNTKPIDHSQHKMQ